MQGKLNRIRSHAHWGTAGQKGGLTLFSAVLILILMTLMLLYASRTGLFESRISANDVRQKIAFNAAEAAVDQGLMFALENGRRILSSRQDAFPPIATNADTGEPITDADGAFTFEGDGWLAPGAERWFECPDPAPDADANHPCAGLVGAPGGAYFYDDDGASPWVSLPFQQVEFPAGVTARTSALLCFTGLNLTTPPFAGGVCDPKVAGSPEAEAEASIVVVLLGYGYSDCTLPAGVASLELATNLDEICTGKATVAKPIANYRALSGSPTVPLVSKSAIDLTGTMDIVPNPNAGGIGVPISGWLNLHTTNRASGPACPPEVCDPSGNTCAPAATNATVEDIVGSSGTWDTCELEEWYGLNSRPANVKCPDNNCGCPVDASFNLSSRAQGNTKVNIDLVGDPDFPCDLFQYFFGEPSSNFAGIRSLATELDDCGDLDINSSGLYWFSGGDCRINSGQIGTPENPVILVSAAAKTTIVGQPDFFGLLYVFNGEVEEASLAGGGTITVYGAVVVDASMRQFNGNLSIVYSPGVLVSAAGVGSFGSVNGGWRDFGLPDIGW